MAIYNIKIPAIFSIEASSQEEAENKLYECIRKQTSMVNYGQEVVYVPFCHYSSLEIKEVHSELPEVYYNLR